MAQNVTVVKPLDSGGVAVIQNGTAVPAEPNAAAKRPGADTPPQAAKASEAPAGAPEAAPRPLGKARVVVLPAAFAQGPRSRLERELYERLGLSDPSIIENPGYTAHLNDALVNCRKFEVLEREQLRAVIKELDFGESEYANVEKCVKLGQMLNADYVVIPEIRYLHLLAESKTVPYVGETRTQFTTQIGTRMRVVEVATSRIAASNVGDSECSFREPKTLADKAKQAANILESIYAESARNETASIIDSIYPIKVVAVNGDQVTLNRGKGAIVVGEKLKIFKTGGALIDPDTNENLGNDEVAIGELEVTDVKPRVTTAKIVKLEDGFAIKEKDVARRMKETFKRTNYPPDRAKID
jgi:hypothetical protein